MRAPHQQRAQPARWRGKAGVAGDGHQDGDQLLCGVGHGGAVGGSIGFPGPVMPSTPPQPPGGACTTSLISLRSPGRAPALNEPAPLRLLLVSPSAVKGFFTRHSKQRQENGLEN